MVQFRKLGTDGPEVSAIALGSRLVNTSDQEAADKLTIKTIHEAIDSGINFLNTADFYETGHNEMVIGQAIKERKDKVFISVKTGVMRSPTGKFLGIDCRPEAIKNFCSYSLTRLGVDEIDLYQPARIDPNVPIEETIGAIADLVKEGKVKHIGLSEASADQLKRAHKEHSIAALEIEYSLSTRFIEKEILPTARKLGVSVVPYSVLTYGLLTGKLNAPLDDKDYRKAFPRFQAGALEKNLEKVEILKSMAFDKGYSASQLAIAWVLSQGEDIIPVVGMSKPERIANNLKALNINFTAEELSVLNKTFAIGALEGERYPEALNKLVPA